MHKDSSQSNLSLQVAWLSILFKYATLQEVIIRYLLFDIRNYLKLKDYS